jgi:hypothetical protein
VRDLAVRYTDDVEFLRGADLLEQEIGHATRVTRPDAGHHPQMANPAAWLAAMHAHLDGLEGSDGR